MEEGKALLDKIHTNKPFSQKVRQTSLFNSTRKVIGEDIPIPERAPRKKTPPPMTHDKAFKPSNPPKRGNHCTIAKFPEYKENPLKHVERKMPEENADKKSFKPTHNSKSRPSPSVQTNMRNLKASFPSVFRR